MSLLVGQIYGTIENMPEFQSGQWTQHQYVVTLALFAGIVTLGLAILRLGILFNFICQPAIAGFMAGSGLTIVINQLNKIFGIPNINTREAPYLVFGKTLINLNHSRVDAAMGLLSLVFLYGVRWGVERLTRRYPQYARVLFYINITRNVVLIVFTTFLSWLINHFGHLTESPFQILGAIPPGFQMMGVPKIDNGLVSTLFSYIPSVVTLFMMEHCAIATSLGKMSDYKSKYTSAICSMRYSRTKLTLMHFHYAVNVNQELLAIGLSNVLGCFFSAYPGNGSFSRSAVTNKSGSRTPLCNIFVAVIVVLALYVFTPAFYYIPSSSLAAVIIHAVTDLIVGPKVWLKYWRLDPTELLIFAAAYIIALFTRLDVSVYVPVALSLVVQLYRTARPSYAVLGRVSLHAVTDKEKRDIDDNDIDNAMYVPFNHPTLGHCVRPIGRGIFCFQPRDNLVFENSWYLFGELVDQVKRTTRRGKPLADKVGDRPWNDAESGKKRDQSKPLLRAIILDLSGVHQMDYSAMDELKATSSLVDRYSGNKINWYIVINESRAVRKCLLFAGFGRQRRSDKVPGFLSDLTTESRQSNKAAEDDDNVNENVDDVEKGEQKQVAVIEDIDHHHRERQSQIDSNRTAPPTISSDNSSSWSQEQQQRQQGQYLVDCNSISAIDDVYPYFFYSIHDAVRAVITQHGYNDNETASTSSV